MIVGIVKNTMRTGVVLGIYRYYLALLINEILLRIAHD
jgi:hypothetical protein